MLPDDSLVLLTNRRHESVYITNLLGVLLTSQTCLFFFTKHEQLLLAAFSGDTFPP